MVIVQSWSSAVGATKWSLVYEVRMRSIGLRLATAMARVVAALSDEQLGRLERGPLRRLVIGTLPAALRVLFRRRRAAGTSGVVELRLVDPDGGAPACVSVAFADGTCTVARGPSARPTATLTVGIGDLVRMASGAVSSPALVQVGRLRIMGDVFLVMSFPSLFGLPTRPLVARPAATPPARATTAV
jgi:hypothetical protein